MTKCYDGRPPIDKPRLLVKQIGANPGRPCSFRLAAGGFIEGLRGRDGHDSAHRKKSSANYRLCFDITPDQAAFEQAGIQFIDDDETGGFGLRMAKKNENERGPGVRSRKPFTGMVPGSSVQISRMLPSPLTYEKLHQSLIAELAPVGALEDDIVAKMARFVWRKQNLATFRAAELARARYSAIRSRKLPNTLFSGVVPREEKDPAKREAAMRAVEDEARKELGDLYELVEIGKTATVVCLLEDLEVEERLDAMIDKCLKRLLFLRGLKSLSTASSSAPPQPIPKPQRIPGPTRAA